MTVYFLIERYIKIDQSKKNDNFQFTEAAFIHHFYDYIYQLTVVELPIDDIDLKIQTTIIDDDVLVIQSNKLFIKEKYDIDNVYLFEKFQIQMPTVAQCAQKGYFSVLKYLVQNGADIHVNYESALMNSVNHNQFKIVQYLVEQGADIHVNNEYALIESIRFGRLQTVQYLIEQGADIHLNKNKALRKSVYSPKIFKYLINEGADIQACNHLLNCFVKQNNIDMIKYLLKNSIDVQSNENEALITSIHMNFKNIRNLLIEFGADITSCASKALVECALNIDCDLETIQFLVENGADIQSNNNIIITSITSHCDLKIIKYLIQMGADVHSNNDLALKNCFCNNKKNQYDIVEFLINEGANIHIDNEYPLEKSIWQNNFNLFKLLIENGADVHVNKNKNIMNIISLNRYKMLKYLNDVGVDIILNNEHTISNYKHLLSLSITANNLKIIKLLIQLGADISDSLFVAIQLQRYEIIQFFIECGIEIKDECQTLLFAISFGNLKIVQLLVDYGVSVANIDDSMFKIYNDKTSMDTEEIIDYLIDCGANITKES